MIRCVLHLPLTTPMHHGKVTVVELTSREKTKFTFSLSCVILLKTWYTISAVKYYTNGHEYDNMNTGAEVQQHSKHSKKIRNTNMDLIRLYEFQYRSAAVLDVYSTHIIYIRVWSQGRPHGQQDNSKTVGRHVCDWWSHWRKVGHTGGRLRLVTQEEGGWSNRRKVNQRNRVFGSPPSSCLRYSKCKYIHVSWRFCREKG